MGLFAVLVLAASQSGLPSALSESDRAALLADLGAAEPVRHVRATLRLAGACPDVLPFLEASHAELGETARARVVDILGVAMLYSTHASDLAPHQYLRGACKASIERAQEHARTLAGAAFVMADGVRSACGDSEAALAADGLMELRGFGAAAAIELCGESNPVARAYGVLVLTRLRATVGFDSIRGLKHDDALAPSAGADWKDGRRTVEAWARETLRTISAFRRLEDPSIPTRVELHIELMLHAIRLKVDPFDNPDRLINGLHAVGTTAATTEDEWWRLADPAWTAWWGITEASRDMATRDATWLAWVREHEKPR